MKKISTFIFVAIIASLFSFAYSQMGIIGSVNGSVINSISKEPIHEEILAELLDSDGNLISTSTAKLQGKHCIFGFSMYSEGKYTVRLSNENYDTTYVDFKYSSRKRRLPLGKIEMRKLTRAEKGVELGEITVTATKLKFYNKGDTIVYNADAFELASGSMLDGLVSQLPGAELRDDGRIYVNGRFVENILLNGKDFFKGDNKIMLENLPSYMIKDVEVYDKWSFLSEAARKKLDDGTYVMNVKLKKEHSIGWLANAEVGGGTKERYMGRAFALRFSPTSRVSLFGNINNINDTRKPGRNGDWSPADITNGLATTKSGGVDYGLFDQGDNYEINGNVMANYTDGLNDSRTSTQNFLTSGDTYGRSWNRLTNRSLALSTQHSLNYKFGPGDYSRSSIMANLSGQYTKTDNYSDHTSALFDAEPINYGAMLDSIRLNHLVTMPWINTSENRAKTKKREYGASGLFALKYLFPTSDDAFSITVDGNYQHLSYEMRDEYRLMFRESNPEAMNRFNDKPSHKYAYSAQASYIYSPAQSVRIIPSYTFKQAYSNSTDAWYMLESESHRQSSLQLPSMMSRSNGMTFDQQNSYDMGVRTISHIPGVEIYKDFRWMPKTDSWERSIAIHLYLNATYRTDNINFNGIRHIGRNRHTWLPTPALWLSYSHSGQAYFDLTYNMYCEAPAAFNLIDVEFNSDPLNVRTGNPDLRDTYHHKFEFKYYAGRWAREKQIVLNANCGVSIWRDAVALGYTYDPELGVRHYKPQNIDGNWWMWLNSTINIPITRDKRFSMNSSSRLDLTDNADMVGISGQTAPVKRIVHNTMLSENLSFNYKVGIFKLGLLGKVNYRHSTSDMEGFQTINVADFSYGLTGLLKFPWDIELSTDITMFSRRGYSNQSMNTDDLMWNARLSKSVMNGNLTFAVDAFDILRNLSNIRYDLNGQGRTETWVNCIPRYVMLKAIYRLNIQPRKRSAN